MMLICLAIAAAVGEGDGVFHFTQTSIEFLLVPVKSGPVEIELSDGFEVTEILSRVNVFLPVAYNYRTCIRADVW